MDDALPTREHVAHWAVTDAIVDETFIGSQLTGSASEVIRRYLAVAVDTSERYFVYLGLPVLGEANW